MFRAANADRNYVIVCNARDFAASVIACYYTFAAASLLLME
jgi:hypothetical protein